MFIFMLYQPCSLALCCLYSSGVFTQLSWSCWLNKYSEVRCAVQQNYSSHQTDWKLVFFRAKKLWVSLSSTYSEGTEEPSGKYNELIIWGNFRGNSESVLTLDLHSGKRWFTNPFFPVVVESAVQVEPLEQSLTSLISDKTIDSKFFSQDLSIFNLSLKKDFPA